MAIVQKLTPDELALVEILRHPIWCGDFIRNMIPNVKEWVYTSYQKEFLADFNSYVSIIAGRSVGKTETLIDKLVWLVLNKFWDETVVYAVPSRVHLEPVFLRLTRWFRTHPLLKYYTKRQCINSQSFTIKPLNGTVVDCRIAGKSGTGANVVGLHVPIVIVDESAFFPFGTFTELMPILNTWQEGHQLIISGVPDGRREKSVLYFADQKDPQYTKHRVSAHQNPRYTEADEERNIKQYGGEEGEDYIHMVLGQHGDPSYVLFDRTKMLIKNYEVFKGTLYGTKIKEDLSYLSRFYSSLPALPARVAYVMFGIDLGYVEPTVISVMYKQRLDSPWLFRARITLKQVEYPVQERIIDQLDSLYSPQILGIDEGSSGKAVIQHLRSDPALKYKRYKDRVIPIQFRSLVPIGRDDENKEIQVRAKQFGMQLLQSKVNNHQICFSWNDEAMITELERCTYRKTPGGELVFQTMTSHGGFRHGEDHNTAAMLCFVLAYYLREELGLFDSDLQIKLYRPRWF